MLPIVGSDQGYRVRRIYCVGRNYVAHVREMKEADERDPPFFFQKPADAIVLDGDLIPYPPQTRDYQHEIALRHTAAKKNVTDGVGAVPMIELRYMIAFIVPITVTMRDFLAAKGHAREQVDAMHAAWFKAVVLHVTLWARPYAPEVW